MYSSKVSSAQAGKPIRCRAAVSRIPGNPLVIEEIEVDPPKVGEVRIRVLCTSLCHTDVTFWNMKEGPYSRFPTIFGHEAIGVVESVGEDVDEVKEGDTVLPVIQPNCKQCKDCKSLKSNVCSAFPDQPVLEMPRDGTSRFRDLKGEILHHFACVSSFSEYTVVDINHIVKLNHPEIIPLEKACLFSCGVPTGIGAVWKVADVEEGSTVVIFGLGTVGLMVAEGSRRRKASKIIGIDLNPEKFEIAKKFGVTDFINPTAYGNKQLHEVIKEETDGGADFCFECIGSAPIIEQAIKSSRQGWGKTVIVGVERDGLPFQVNSYEIMKGSSITGTLLGGIKPKSDIPNLIQKCSQNELDVEGLITHEVSFKDINTAFELLISGKCLRCIIWIDDQAKEMGHL